jgi:hypothetical protein
LATGALLARPLPIGKVCHILKLDLYQLGRGFYFVQKARRFKI